MWLLKARQVPHWRIARFSQSTRLISDAMSSEAPADKPKLLPKDGLTLSDFLPGGEGPSATRAPVIRKPPWLKMANSHLTPEGGERYKQVRDTIKNSGLSTVCQEARCPNIGECWAGGTATVMIMGDTCTRGCRFCSVATSRNPPPPDANEPEKVAEAVAKWGVDYIVLTMVDRDDLPDQGAAHVARTVRQLKIRQPDIRVETLIGDFQGKLDLVSQVVHSGMDVFAHNVETVERLQSTVRDRRAGYAQSMSVLRHALQAREGVVTKSSLMLGLGETDEEVHQVLRDLKDNGVEIVTFGQYLQPTKRHMKVTRYVTPAEFDQWKVEGEALGLHVQSGPMVRSSYKAGEFFKERLAKQATKRGESINATGGVRPAEVSAIQMGLSQGA
mmetsp:Transcript_23446/g.37718  ORF Transcript_23446/g.37718 Transcript_23446/m.37718 type:complete len:387 (+) Transcript_23446:79-1239(+)